MHEITLEEKRFFERLILDEKQTVGPMLCKGKLNSAVFDLFKGKKKQTIKLTIDIFEAQKEVGIINSAKAIVTKLGAKSFSCTPSLTGKVQRTVKYKEKL